MIDATARTHVLVVRIGGSLGALPIGDVVETMRPLPTQPVTGMPPFVTGLALVRGLPIPVVNLSQLVAGEARTAPSRFVTVRLGARHAALAVDEVLGVRALDSTRLGEMPPLAGTHHVEALGGLDDRLLLLLEGSRLLLADVERALDAQGPV